MQHTIENSIQNHYHVIKINNLKKFAINKKRKFYILMQIMTTFEMFYIETESNFFLAYKHNLIFRIVIKLCEAVMLFDFSKHFLYFI